MKKILAFAVFLLTTANAFAQIEVKGYVRDNDGEPVPGATVIISGTDVGAVTDINGRYTISINSPDASLFFTCIGYDDVTEKVSGRTVIDVVLTESVDALEESVVVGYGSLRKTDMTGSVSTLKSESMENKVLFSVDDALAGGVAGLMVSSASGKPGSASTMLIRGANSLSGSTSPLIVIDGFPLFDISTSAGSGINDTGLSSLSLVNTNDIASIEVLKDASATAIYGNRGANGVIIITTKKGRADGGRIQYNMYVGAQELNRRYDMMDAQEYADYQSDVNSSNSMFYDSAASAPRDVRNLPTCDWQDRIFRTGFLQNHSLSISNSSKRTNFMLSGSYQQNKSILICTDYRKFTAKASVDHYFTNRVRMGLDINYSRIMDDGVPTGGEGTEQSAGIITSALVGVPYDIMDPNTQAIFRKAGVSPTILNNHIGNYHGNPVTQAYDTQMMKVINRTIMNSYLEVDILQNLVLRVTGCYDVFSLKDRQFYPTTTGRGYFYKGEGLLANSESTTWINENTLTWKPIFGKHRLNIVAGVTEQGFTSFWDWSNFTQFEYEGLGYNNADMAKVYKINSSKGRVTYLSFLGRVNYSYDNRYIATFTARRDGTSLFIKNKWGSFFSGAVAWNVDNEAFMKNQNTVNTLKLRLRAGQVGNSNVPTTGSYAQLFGNFYSFADVPAIGQSPASIANEELTWETTTEGNLGVELGLFKDRFLINLDVYNKVTSDLLLEAPVINISGFEKAWQNIGKMRNRGIELSVNALILKTKDWKWTANANFSHNKTRILELSSNGEPIYLPVACVGSGNIIKLEEGGEIGNIYGYRTIGVYGLNEFEKDGRTPRPETAIETGNERPGAMKFADLSGADGVPDGKITADDRTVIGNTSPDFYGAFGTDISWKNYSLSVGFQYSYGADVYNANYKVLAKFNAEGHNQMAFYADRWTEDNLESTMYNSMTVSQVCSAFVEDASFLRLKNARFTWNLPERWFGPKTRIGTIRVYAACENVFVLTRYSGYDPEVSNSTNVLTAGFDYGCFPRPRTYTLGVNIIFK
jgi:TonB-linked SusC/RagA family outer membrane protein